jgi:hypothetical protein
LLKYEPSHPFFTSSAVFQRHTTTPFLSNTFPLISAIFSAIIFSSGVLKKLKISFFPSLLGVKILYATISIGLGIITILTVSLSLQPD